MLKLKKILLIICFCLLIPTPISAIDITDVNDINDTFLFSEDVGKGDMKFKGADGSNYDFWNLLYDKYAVIIILISGVVSLLFFLFFLKHISRYAINSGNPKERSNAMIGFLWTGIASGLFGIVSFLVTISYFFVK